MHIILTDFAGVLGLGCCWPGCRIFPFSAILRRFAVALPSVSLPFPSVLRLFFFPFFFRSFVVRLRSVFLPVKAGIEAGRRWYGIDGNARKYKGFRSAGWIVAGVEAERGRGSLFVFFAFVRCLVWFDVFLRIISYSVTIRLGFSRLVHAWRDIRNAGGRGRGRVFSVLVFYARVLNCKYIRNW